MKTFNVWLILEETEDNDPVQHITTDEVAVFKDQRVAENAFEEYRKAVEVVTDDIPSEMFG